MDNSAKTDNPYPEESYNSLIAQKPDGGLLEFRNVQVDTTLSEILQAIVEYDKKAEATSGKIRYAIDLIRDDGTIKRLNPTETLREAGVRDGDHLRLAAEVSAGGGSIGITVAEFLATAMAGGISGNAAYDLLKSTVRSLAARWRKGRITRQAPALSEKEAISIARNCACLQLHIPNPQQLVAMSAQHNIGMSDHFDEWVISFCSNGVEHTDYVTALVRSYSAEPRDMRVLITAHPLL